jgi:cell division protein FtsA
MGNNPKTINQNNNDIVVGLDIGTTKIIALVAKRGENPDSLHILGIGIAESEGLNRGVVVNIEKTVRSINKVIQQAEQQSGIKIENVIVGIAGDHIESFKTRGIIGISSPTQEISEDDVERLLEETKKVSIPSERQIIHVIPQEFYIDGQDGITEPIGMNGVRMEANVHVVTGLKTAIRNLYTCVERAGLKVQDVILEPIASSYSVLSHDEKEVGVALIDIGGGTTDIAIFEENVIRHTSVIGIAGRQVTDDIRKGLGIIHTEAERIKRENGHAFGESIMSDDVIMIPGIAGRNPIEINKSTLCSIIQPRMEEIFEFAMEEIVKSGYADRLGAGIVITGGNTLLNGTDALANEIFGKPIKIGIPAGITYNGLGPEVESPIYSTAVGLANYSLVNTYKSSKIDLKQNNESSKAENKSKYDDTAEVEVKEEKKTKADESKYKKNKEKISWWDRFLKFIKEL